MLQEFVQSSRQLRMPQKRAILQWNYDNRMADFATLQFSAHVAFMLNGVPHHVAGMWHLSKKAAQRDTAECALNFFMKRRESHAFRPTQASGKDRKLSSKGAGGAVGGRGRLSEQAYLEKVCRRLPDCDGELPRWEYTWDEHGRCIAVAELLMQGVPHKLAGKPQLNEEAAHADTVRRVLWYLRAPGYEDMFEPDPFSPAVVGTEIPMPPKRWVGDTEEEDALQVAERKTALMRVQNRLQQTFAKQLQLGQSVWDWTFETDPDDTEWPPLCRATAHVAVINQDFTGDWARGQRAAQIKASDEVAVFLDRVSFE